MATNMNRRNFLRSIAVLGGSLSLPSLLQACGLSGKLPDGLESPSPTSSPFPPTAAEATESTADQPPEEDQSPSETPDPGTARVALEAYPGFTARQLCRGSYKSDTKSQQTPERAANRRCIIRGLVAGTAGLLPRLELSATWRRKLAADPAGDLLDAVISGLQAAHAALVPGYGLPADLDPLEGWIASVPPPRGA